MQYTALAILIVGIIALLVEILMPGFVFFGISGLVLLIISGVLTILFVVGLGWSVSELVDQYSVMFGV